MSDSTFIFSPCESVSIACCFIQYPFILSYILLLYLVTFDGLLNIRDEKLTEIT